MSTDIASNPFAYTESLPQPEVDPTSPQDEAGTTAPIVAHGPISFRDYRHALQSTTRASRGLTVAIVTLMLAWSLSHVRYDLVTPLVTLLFVGIFVIVRRVQTLRQQRRAHQKETTIRKWVIDARGVEQHATDGNIFIPNTSIASVSNTDRVVTITTSINLQHFIPRTGFIEDHEWQRCLSLLHAVGGRETAVPDRDSVEPIATNDDIVVRGPMSDVEAQALIAEVRGRQTFFARYVFLILPTTLALATLAAPTLHLLRGESLTDVPPVILMTCLFSILVAAGGIYVHRSIPRLLLSQIKQFQSWTVREEHLETLRGGVTVQLNWEDLSLTGLIPEGILLRLEKGALLVPRSGFEDEVCWRRACALVERTASSITPGGKENRPAILHSPQHPILQDNGVGRRDDEEG